MQPVVPIEVQPPVPSILTTARNRTADQFGTRAAPDVEVAEGSPEPLQYSWRTGISWTQSTCQPSTNWPNCPSQDDITAGKEAADGEMGPVDVAPFWIYTPVECDWQLDRSELVDVANRLLDAHTANGVGRALWLGDGLPDVATQPTLRRSAQNITPAHGAAMDLDDAVALCLAHYEVGTGGNGGAVVHLPSIVITAATGAVPGGSVIARLVGTHYEGPLGSWISPGPGYPFGRSTTGADGFGPLHDPDVDGWYLGNDEDEVWVYVTGPVEYAVGPLQPISPQRIGGELRQNRDEIWSERQAIVRFDPCSTYACLANSPVAYVEPS